MDQPRKILLATDIPFWNRGSGAEQRIAQLVEQFQNWEMKPRVFYIGPKVLPNSIPNHLDVVCGSSEIPPKQLAPQLKWHYDAILNQLGWQFGNRVDPDKNSSLTLADFIWPWAKQQFAEQVQQFQPTHILIEYVKLAYLLDALSKQQRHQVHCLLDSHDVLHQRCEQFQSRGLNHWISLSEEEEVATILKFDSVLAIQQHEADYFRRVIQTHTPKQQKPETEVCVVGFAAASVSGKPDWGNPQQTVFGYIGSANASNEDACRWLINEIWP